MVSIKYCNDNLCALDFLRVLRPKLFSWPLVSAVQLAPQLQTMPQLKEKAELIVYK
jgi:hypothetical protein